MPEVQGPVTAQQFREPRRWPTSGPLVRERALPAWAQVGADAVRHPTFRQTFGEKQLGDEGSSRVRERPLPKELEAEESARLVVRGDSHTEGDAEEEGDRFQSRRTGEQLLKRVWLAVREQRRRTVQLGS